MTEELKEMSILEHLDELRKRLIICIISIITFSLIAYLKSDEIIIFIKQGVVDINLIFITPVEGFLVKLKVALFAGVIVSVPIIFWQIILFFSPALYRKEKIIFISIIILGTLLFFIGIYFCFTFILPATMKVLLSFGKESMQPMLSADKYFSFLFILILVTGVIFQLPLFMILLSMLGIIEYKILVKYRKIVLFNIFVLTAVLTPTPDAVTLCLVALPMVLLYEFGLFVLYVYDKFK